MLRSRISNPSTARNFQYLSKRFKTCAVEAPIPKPVGTCRGLILGVYEKPSPAGKPKLSAGARLFDQKINGNLAKVIDDFNITGELNKGRVIHNLDADFDAVAIVGIGPEKPNNDKTNVDQVLENVRIAAGLGARMLQKQNCISICVDDMEFAEQSAEGTALKLWKFDDSFLTGTKDSRANCATIKLYGPGDANKWLRGLLKADAQNLVRNLCELPSNKLTPTEFGNQAAELLCGQNVSVTVRSEDWIFDQNMNATM